MASALRLHPPVLVLFDHGTPKGLARALPGHTIQVAQAKGWDTLSNGDFLNAAEEAGFDWNQVGGWLRQLNGLQSAA